MGHRKVKLPLPIRWAIAVSTLFLLFWLAPGLVFWMLMPQHSTDEVARVPSPNGMVDAVVIETNGGATTSYGYEVYLTLPKGQVNDRPVASLYGAERSDHAWGITLQWVSAEKLSVQYLSAKSTQLNEPSPVVGSQRVQVVLESNRPDANAPQGNMVDSARKSP